MLTRLSRKLLVILTFTSIVVITVLGSECDEQKKISHRKTSSHKHTSFGHHKADHSGFTKHNKSILRKTAVHRHNSHHHKLANARAQAHHTKTNATKHIAAVASTIRTKQPTSKLNTSDDTATHMRASVTSSSKSSYISATGSKLTVSMSGLTSSCGAANPTDSPTESGGPNGSQDFLNCGITGGGWEPPKVLMSMIKTVSLETEPAKTTFAPCSQYTSIFEKYGQKYNIPPIFLAAFAMQESSCNPTVKGDNGGAWGLMQITTDKCGGAPGGDCANPDFNVDMGAKTFADGLSAAGGNVLVALGAYNGWSKGLTKSQAIAAKNTGCCVCQQNLDYLQQFLNGWCLGVDPYTKKIGMMRNLDSCGDGL